MTEPPYLSEYQAGYVFVPSKHGRGLMPGTATRTFSGGATRDVDDNKLDFEGFLSPQVLQAFAEYMHKHRLMKDGSVRSSDNWQNGMPKSVYVKSLARHFFDLWLMHRLDTDELTRPDGEHVTLADTLGGIQFNLQGYWLETLKDR
jgi:hypothetical protein